MVTAEQTVWSCGDLSQDPEMFVAFVSDDKNANSNIVPFADTTETCRSILYYKNEKYTVMDPHNLDKQENCLLCT